MGSAQSSVVSLHSLAEISAESLTTDDWLPKTAQGTAKGTGFDRRFEIAQVAQVTIVGYSFDEAGMAFAKGYGVSYLAFLALTSHR